MIYRTLSVYMVKNRKCREMFVKGNDMPIERRNLNTHMDDECCLIFLQVHQK